MADLAEVLGEDSVVGDLLAGAQRGLDLVALALEIFFSDALLHAQQQNGGGARAVAELGLLASEEAVREPAFEGHPEKPLFGLVGACELPRTLARALRQHLYRRPRSRGRGRGAA